MLLSCHHLSKSFGDQVIVEDGSFQIDDHEKVGFVGVNGAGKSTVLRMIVGEEPLDAGEIILTRGKSFGYLAQQQDDTSERTIYEEVKTAKAHVIDLEQQIRDIEIELKSLSGPDLSSRLETYNQLMSRFETENGYAYESEITGVLKGLGFDEPEFDQPVRELSGGQKTRVALGKLLLSKPDILLLDEPTNHLDLPSISWLEAYLINYPGAVFVVSHDRYFLNRIVTKVVEIDQGVLQTYQGNYEAYAEKKQQLRDARLKAYLNQQREIKHQEDVIETLHSFNREKSVKRAESREKALQKITVIEPPSEEGKMRLSFHPQVESGKDVLTVEHLSKGFTNQPLFEEVSFQIKRGEHVAIIGENGTGKTTLLKLINQLTDADSGTITLGSKVRIGYYDQEYHTLNNENTVFDEISDTFPDLTQTEIRNTLAAFQFIGDDVFKQIRDLSGGEKGRVSLVKLMLSGANFLILDEPTNHLDIPSREILEQALNEYDGTILYVSHDRYFINQTAHRILELSHQTFTNYLGNYDYYLEKKEDVSPSEDENKGKKASKGTDYQSQKEAQARERKRKNEIKKTEDKISALENRNREIDRLLTTEEVYSDPIRCQELVSEKDQNETEIDLLYDQWEALES